MVIFKQTEKDVYKKTSTVRKLADVKLPAATSAAVGRRGPEDRTDSCVDDGSGVRP